MQIDLEQNTELFQQTDAWADHVINWFSKDIERGEKPFLWYYKLWFHEPGDVWGSPQMWMVAAKHFFPDHPYDAGTLRVLLHYQPDQYRQIVLEKTEKFFRDGAPDPEDWYPILSYFYPEREIAREVFDDPFTYCEDTYRLCTLIGSRGSETITSYLKRVFSQSMPDLDDEPLDIINIHGTADMIVDLGKKSSEALFNPDQLAKVKEKCVELSMAGLKDYWMLVRVAWTMGWHEILEALENNPGYFRWLFEGDREAELFRDQTIITEAPTTHTRDEIPNSHFNDELLAWGLTPRKRMAANIAYFAKGILKNRPYSINHFALALAWKRARSPLTFNPDP